MTDRFDQIKANCDDVEAILKRVQSARWRLIRNHRLLRQSRSLLQANQQLLRRN